MTPPTPNSGESSDSIHVECEYDVGTAPSVALVRAIAVIENVDPMHAPSALGMTLADHVNPDALDTLVAATEDGAGVTVELTLHDDHRYAVQLRDTGHLVVERSA